MDEKKLNDEIISCRGAVRKAKVAVIRKIIKKMKILKTCKLETVKEKKLRKSERLFEKVQIMKKLKDDEVTTFALRNKDLEVFIKGPGSDLKLNAMASLAKHDAVLKKINPIKEQFSDWEKELPLLLDSLEKNGRVVINNNNNNSNEIKKEFKKVKVTKKFTKKKNTSKTKQKDSELNDDSKGVVKNALHTTEEIEKTEKIEDPFFIEKKVIAPKLILESLSNQKSYKTEFPKKSFIKKNNNSRGFNEKTLKRYNSMIKAQKYMPKAEEEKLHPSWAAKKVKLIKPFQGKKITFSDE